MINGINRKKCDSDISRVAIYQILPNIVPGIRNEKAVCYIIIDKDIYS